MCLQVKKRNERKESKKKLKIKKKQNKNEKSQFLEKILIRHLKR